MLTDALKDEIQSAYRQFLNNKNLKPRYGQRLMLALIARTLGGIEVRDGERVSGNHLCVVEAGTGTGKTLAYLLATIPIAQALDKTLVISTATVALQEQLTRNDIPDVQRHTDLAFSATLAKGRGRYLCLAKLDAILSGGEQPLPGMEDSALAPDAQALTLYSSMADALASNDWDGDQDEWPETIAHQHWSRLTTDQGQCTGRRCAHVRNCSFYRARDSIGDSDVIVANHDLLLADLALGGGNILPPPEQCIFVIDEAHHLPDKALNHFSHQLRLQTTLRWLEQSERHIGDLLGRSEIHDSLRKTMEAATLQMVQAREELSGLRGPLQTLLDEAPEDAKGFSSGFDRGRLRFERGIVVEPLRTLAPKLCEVFGTLAQTVDQMGEGIEDLIDENAIDAPRQEQEQWLSLIGAMASRANAAAALWQTFSVDATREKPPNARWLQMVEAGGGAFDIELCCSPVLAANTLSQHLWPRCFAAVMTSATLTALNSFDRFRMRSGVNDGVFEQVPSPFDYPRVAKLTIPAMTSDAGRGQEHTQELVALIPQIVDLKEGTLVLFSSRRQMLDVYDQLPGPMQQGVLLQGKLSKQEILKRHSETIEKGIGSIIFGLATFAEGVDLPGPLCSHVIIAKIPFAVPNDPVEQALAEWIENNDGNAFMEVSVPDAAQRLVQASGRLLRRESDTGRVTILDRRLLTRRYGRRMLDSLPPFGREIS